MRLAVRTLQLAGAGSLTPERAREMVARGGQLVDIRTPEDAQAGTVNLPAQALRHDSHLLDRHEPVILCGAAGIACVRAARLLAGRGFDRIYHLDTQALC